MQHKTETNYRNKAVSISVKEKATMKFLWSGPSLAPPYPLPLKSSARLIQLEDVGSLYSSKQKWRWELGVKHNDTSCYSSRQYHTQTAFKDTNVQRSQFLLIPHTQNSTESFTRKAAGLSRTVCFYHKLYFKVIITTCRS